MATFQMRWDCPQCGAAGLLGVDHRFCPGCGAPQDPEARYFPSEDQKRAVVGPIAPGPDRACPRCGTANTSTAAFCVACGAGTDGAVEVARRERQSAGAQDSSAGAKQEHRARRQAAEDARRAAVGPPDPEAGSEGSDPVAALAAHDRRTRRRALTIGAVAVAVAALVALGVWALSLRETLEVTVSGHAWERSIAVETLQAVRGSGWDEDVPSDARERSCSRRERGSQQVRDGESCHTERVDHGNGSFSEEERCTPTYRSVPTYDQHCEWVVDRWRTVRTAASRGGFADRPAWPALHLGSGEREGARRRSEQVTFLVPGPAVRSCEIEVDRWPSMPVGSAWTVEAGLLTGALDCDTLRAR